MVYHALIINLIHNGTPSIKYSSLVYWTVSGLIATLRRHIETDICPSIVRLYRWRGQLKFSTDCPLNPSTHRLLQRHRPLKQETQLVPSPAPTQRSLLGHVDGSG
jgi:hypothetical protein